MADEDADALAAEYVLGTLTAEERDRVVQLAAGDAAFAARLAAWERRLGVLEAMVEPVEPPADVWDKIRDRVAEVEPEAAIRLPEIVPAAIGRDAEDGTRDAAAGKVVALTQGMQRWRGIAVVAAAIAAVLLIAGAIERLFPELLPAAMRRPVETRVVEKEVEKVAERVVEKVVEKVVEVPQPAPGRLVAVLQRETGTAAFLLTVDAADRSLTARRIAPPEAGKSHELWLVSDKFPAPRSLGVLGPDEFTRQALSAYDPETITAATYAVSLEPEGGSPTGAPTGPVLFTGKLVEAVPARP